MELSQAGKKSKRVEKFLKKVSQNFNSKDTMMFESRRVALKIEADGRSSRFGYSQSSLMAFEGE